MCDRVNESFVNNLCGSASGVHTWNIFTLILSFLNIEYELNTTIGIGKLNCCPLEMMAIVLLV